MTAKNPDQRRVAVWTGGRFGPQGAKTAASLVRLGRRWRVACVVDEQQAGADAGEVLGTGRLGVPVVADIAAAGALGVDTLVIGIAPLDANDRLPGPLLRAALDALERGLDVVTGTHAHLNAHPELVAAARRAGAQLVDLRCEPPRRVLAQQPTPIPAHVVLTAGTDCSVGKMTTAILLHRQALDTGLRSAFLATGQTGAMCGAQACVIVDHALSDFVSGAVQQALLELAESGFEIVFVEGQGSVLHPAYSAVTVGLLYGAAPDTVVVCHDAGRTTRKYFDHLAVPGPAAEFAAIRALTDGYCRAELAGMSMMNLGQDGAMSGRLGVPVVDVLAPGGAATLLEAVLRHTPARAAGPRAAAASASEGAP
jgi:uncharacterized NAD-dependent epimerase/dehydratase family protein